jgi:Uma2 family endonuclease
VYGLIKQLDEDYYEVYSNSPMIYISLAGRRRVPDITVTPPKTAWKEEKGHLVNPHLVIEVLSPSNAGEDFMEKIEDYKSLESLQEYWLVSQDKPRIERFVRLEGKRWENLTYNAEDTEINFPSLGISLKTNKVYKDVNFKK